MVVEILDKTINPWLVSEGHELIQSVEHAAARFWHWLCAQLHARQHTDRAAATMPEKTVDGKFASS